MAKNASDTGNYTDPKTGKVVSSGQYIPDDNPDLKKAQEKREKVKKFHKKISSLIPFKTKKLKKAIKEEEDKPLKKSTTKYFMEDKINRKANKMTKSEGSFSKGGRAGYKGGGMSQRGLGRAFMKGGKV
jgi:hypothetical protein